MSLKRPHLLKVLMLLILTMTLFQCEQTVTIKNTEIDMSTLENEIELRLREYEGYLKNGDSLALGNMYTEDAEIIPSTVGRDNIIKAFSHMIKDSITGSSFTTTKLWGNDQLLVEDGMGTWYHADGTAMGSGRYLLVWKKDDGEWKILRDTWFPEKKK